MHLLPLTYPNGHLFVTIGDHDWLLDTGSPTSFGNIPSSVIENREFSISNNYLGLTAVQLSEYIGHQTAGIIGANVLNELDIILAVPKERLLFTDAQIESDGDVIETDEFMGIPIIQTNISGSVRRMFFDSGAQIS
jgi:hypothetical protein